MLWEARKGVFITTSTFTRDAIQFADTIETKIIPLRERGLPVRLVLRGQVGGGPDVGEQGRTLVVG